MHDIPYLISARDQADGDAVTLQLLTITISPVGWARWTALGVLQGRRGESYHDGDPWSLSPGAFVQWTLL